MPSGSSSSTEVCPASGHLPAFAHKAAIFLRTMRERRQRIEGLPEEIRPLTVAQGVAVQDAFVGQSAHSLVGWKLGGTTDSSRAAFGTHDVFFGRLLSGMVYDSPAVLAPADFYQTAVEPEITFVFGRTLEPCGKYFVAEEVAAAVGAIYPSLEVPDSCFKDAVAAGLPSLIADDCAAGALVLGNAIADWQEAISFGVGVALEAGERTLANGVTTEVSGGPLTALTAFVNQWTGLGRRIPAGCLVATGGCTPCTKVPCNVPIIADFGPLGCATLAFRDNYVTGSQNALS